MAEWFHAVSLQVLTNNPIPDLTHVDAKYKPPVGVGITLASKGFPVLDPVALSTDDADERERYELAIGTTAPQ
eukprot:scaffold63649_cov73-Attheya_sp.AAC.1